MKKDIVRPMLIMLLNIFLICGLSACNSKTAEKTEKEISNDIQTKDSYFSSYNLKVDSFSISKRQTNQEDKNDFVWCTVTASNDNFTYTSEYQLTYVLYNDGWQLEEYYQDSSSVTPSSYPDDKEVLTLVTEYFENHKLHDAQYEIKRYNSIQEGTTITYPCRILFPHDEYIPCDYAVIYQFNPQTGWTSEVRSVQLNFS